MRRTFCDLTARHFINEYDIEGEASQEGGLGSREGMSSSRESGSNAVAISVFDTSVTDTNTDTDVTATATATAITATTKLAKKENPYHPPIYQHLPEEIKRNTIAMELLCTDR